MTNRWVLGARPRTLPAAVMPVVVGTGVAEVTQEIVLWKAGLALVVSLALQVATNYVNDYADGERGTDDDRVGPPRLVGGGLATASQVKRAALAAFAVAAVAGTVLAVTTAWWLLLVGAACVVAAYAYTGGSKPYGYLGLGELFVFVFFGLVATVGTTYVQTERVTALAVLSAVPVGLLACALLVVNNLRDIPGDTAAGKVTLAVRLGDGGTRVLYAVLVLGALVMVAPIAFEADSAWPLVALVSTALAIGPLRLVERARVRGPGLIPVLGMTARVQLWFGLLLTLGLVQIS